MSKRIDDSVLPRNGIYLGRLCRKGHEYEDTGKSLRVSSKHCAICERVRSRTTYRSNSLILCERQRQARLTKLEHYRKVEAAKRERTRNELRLRQKEFNKRKRQTEPEKVSEIRRRYYRRNAVRIKLRSRLFKAFKMFSTTGKTQRADEYGIDYDAIINTLGPCPGSSKDWHIDHKRPLASFDFNDEGQIREAFAPSNHQWLPAQVNLSKSCKYVSQEGR